jgi:hypothetical protein
MDKKMKKITIKSIVHRIAVCEGKKSQVKVGDVREITAIISDLVVKYPGVIAALIENGLKRASKKKK